MAGTKRNVEESSRSESVSAHVRGLSDSEDEVEFFLGCFSALVEEKACDSHNVVVSSELHGVHAVTPCKRQAEVRSKIQPSGPVFTSGMSVEDLALAGLDLMEASQLENCMEQLESAHLRNWNSD